MLPKKGGQLCAGDDFFRFLGTAGANVRDLERLEDRFGGELVGDKTPIGAIADLAAMGDQNQHRNAVGTPSEAKGQVATRNPESAMSNAGLAPPSQAPAHEEHQAEDSSPEW